MAQFVKSPNFTIGRGGYKIQGIVIHWMVGTLAGTDARFKDPASQVSAHYGAEDSKEHQYVQEVNTAWHAGNLVVNYQTLGIEISAAPGRSPSTRTYETVAKRVAASAKKYGFAINHSTITPHKQHSATRCPGSTKDGKKIEEPGGVDIPRIIKRANEILKGSSPAPKPTPAPAPKPPTGTIVVGSKVRPKRALSYDGVVLSPHVTKNTYPVIEARGSRVVLGAGLNTAFRRSDLALVTGGSSAKPKPAPKPAPKPGSGFKVGDRVRVTNPVDYKGTKLSVSGVYNVIEAIGDRIVIGRNGQVTAAMKASNLRRA